MTKRRKSALISYFVSFAFVLFFPLHTTTLTMIDYQAPAVTNELVSADVDAMLASLHKQSREALANLQAAAKNSR
jgi:hypothetical protein